MSDNTLKSPGTGENSAHNTEGSDATSQSRKEVNVDALMAKIREEVASELDSAPRVGFQPESRGETTSESPLLYAEELNYLNAHWSNWATRTEITSHRPIVGRFIVRVKSFLVDIAWNYLLKDYFERERQFQMHLVRHLNATARYIDARVGSIFWDLVGKIDSDILELSARVDRLFDEASATTRTIELDLNARMSGVESKRQKLESSVGAEQTKIQQMADVLKGLERTVSLLGKAEYLQAPQPGAHESSPNLYNSGVDYLLLENRYRGSEEEIKNRQRDYVSYFEGASLPVLELGSGRGEFLELLDEAGVECLGVDLDRAMIARCKEKGLNVELEDALAFLASIEDNCLGGIFAAQVVEHLTQEQLQELFRSAVRVLVPGGKILLETINPASFAALARNFFRDPTHIWPLHPDTLGFLMETNGLEHTTTLMRSPYPEEAMLKPLEVSEYLPPRWKGTLEGLNQNIARLNETLFGYQDYCIVGTKTNG